MPRTQIPDRLTPALARWIAPICFASWPWPRSPWRESLRDIEVCLTANQAKLFHMGLKTPPARSTLSDALNLRNWRIYHTLAQRLIIRARALYAQEPSLLEIDASVYALDSTTIDLCLSLFDWASFRSTKAAVQMQTLLDLRGAIPAYIRVSDGKMADVKVLDILPIEAGAFYVMGRSYVEFEPLYAMHRRDRRRPGAQPRTGHQLSRVGVIRPPGVGIFRPVEAVA